MGSYYQITQDTYNNIMDNVMLYEKEIVEHNKQQLKSLGRKAEEDFEELIDGCYVTEKIKFVDKPKGIKQDENCGVFKNVYVEQWSTGISGDSYCGFIYAHINGLWIEVPYMC
jgi:hypothetical protein